MKRKYSFLPVIYRVTFTNRNGSEFVLKYKLYNHEGTQTWIKLMQKTMELQAIIHNGGVFYGRPFNDPELMVELIGQNVSFHNKYIHEHNLSSDWTIPITIDSPPTQERLNKLHEYFESLVETPDFQSVHRPLRDNLMALNINIHKTESAFHNSDDSHIELNSSKFIKVPMPEVAYPHFSLDHIFGELTLDYGITGVPTLNAFVSNSTPTPQNFMSNGVMLTFWNDMKFDQWDKLRTWLHEKGFDPDDPKCALGYLPLGIIEEIESLDRKVLLKSICEHPYVSKFELINEEPITRKKEVPSSLDREAQWPFDPEIHYNLDLVPYIDLNVAFDAKKLYDEALKAREYFVVHREYDQRTGENVGKWKSLGLRTLFGDYTKTNYHTEYKFEGPAVYRNTPFAELCPETMKFLSTITDVDKCERIRFMLLEPGGSIKVHRDSTRDTSIAVNISLNMPEGCEMHAQLNPDGTENPYTVKLPFKDSGSVLLFNNAKYHKVVNNSSVHRIHIIFHGPIKFSDKEILDLAKKQNRIQNRPELLNRLVTKKGHLSESLENSKSLMADWLASGIRHNSLPSNMVMAIYDHKQYFNGHSSDHHLDKRTLASLFPLTPAIIKEDDWDDFLLASFQLGKEIVILIAAGTFVNNLNKFMAELVRDSNHLLSGENVAAGHLMDFNNGKHLPYFHEQFIIINLKRWNQVGRPKLGSIFSPEKSELRAVISKNKKHDDYTPEYIRASLEGEEAEVRYGEFGWGSGLIIKAIEGGLGVMNLSDLLRNNKLYSYPRDELSGPKEEIENLVRKKLNFSRNEVYYFNNESLHVINLPDFRPEKFVSVAAGMKPFQILRQFKASPGCEIHFRDFSKPALEYIKAVSLVENLSELEKTIVDKMTSDPLKKFSPETAMPLLNNVIRDYFDDSPEELVGAVKLAKNASFEVVNLIEDPESFIKLFRPKEKFFAWISNAFYNNQLFLFMTKEEAEDALIRLVYGIACQTDLRAFRYKGTHNFVFGKGLDFIKGILTDGSLREAAFDKGLWNEVVPG